jgi:hypothetical protein
VAHDERGTPICHRCAAKDAQAVSSAVAGAVAILVGGILSLALFRLIVLVSIVTILGGVAWLLTVARDPARRAKMGSKFIPATLGVCVGMLCAAVPVVIFVLMEAALGP